jgi:hypothetical protein
MQNPTFTTNPAFAMPSPVAVPRPIVGGPGVRSNPLHKAGAVDRESVPFVSNPLHVQSDPHAVKPLPKPPPKTKVISSFAFSAAGGWSGCVFAHYLFYRTGRTKGKGQEEG